MRIFFLLAALALQSLAGSGPVEQTSQGVRPPLPLLESFDGLGADLSVAQPPRNPSDNSLAVGPEHVFQIVNSQFAIFTRKGKVVQGPATTNSLFKGFGGPCEERPNGDAVVRFDQLAGRWLVVMPIFRRVGPANAYAICYAVSATGDPTGAYHRYAFDRELFPDYPRPAVWPDGYYVPTSTGDEVIEKHVCVADRSRMLLGLPATEQCLIVRGVNFLNTADLDGTRVPAAGAPNVIMATGGTQLENDIDDDGIYVWKMRVDWHDPRQTSLEGPRKIAVAPYRYLCGGQLTSCVPQPGSDRRLDAQGDKIMARLVYRRIGNRESIVAVHSVNTTAGGGGVRWYEFRVDGRRNVTLYQQGTYAPEGFYRWMASPAIDARGNIGIG